LDKGRGDNEIDFDKEDFVVDSYARPIALELNAIDIPRPAFIPSYYVQSATSDDDDDDVPVTAAIPFAVASSKMKEVTSVEGNNPEAPRAQIDTGAFTSFTDQHPVATPAISSAAGVASSDPELADTSQRTTIQAIYAHQEGDYVLDKCPIGIQAKQIDEPAGSHMTCFATAYSQRLSIDFSVSGAINLSDDLMKPLGWILHDRHDRRMITIADMTTAIMSMLAVVARAAPVLPSSDNLTVLAYTLSPSSAPCVNSVSDNVPLSFGIGRVSIGLCSLCPWFALLLSKVHFLLYRLNATYLLNLLNRGGCWRTDE
jgi:hypothetical protein